MKYTLHGFNQETALNLGISNDELALLRWFVDFKDSGTMKKKYDSEKQKMFYWIVYTKIIDDLPLLTLGSESLEAKKKKLQRLINGNISKVLEKKIERDKNGTYLYVAINETEYIKLISSEDRTKMSEGVGQISPMGAGQNCPNKDYSISNDSSINNINKKKKKETDFDLIIKEYTTNEELKTNIYEFIKMRKGIKAAITSAGLKRILSKLNTLSKNNDDIKIKILDNSIMNSWKGVFALKEDYKEVKNNGSSKQNIKPTTTKEIRGEGEELYKRAVEKYGDKLEDTQFDF